MVLPNFLNRGEVPAGEDYGIEGQASAEDLKALLPSSEEDEE